MEVEDGDGRRWVQYLCEDLVDVVTVVVAGRSLLLEYSDPTQGPVYDGTELVLCHLGLPVV